MVGEDLDLVVWPEDGVAFWARNPYGAFAGGVVYRCAACGCLIKGDYVLANDLTYHPEHISVTTAPKPVVTALSPAQVEIRRLRALRVG